MSTYGYSMPGYFQSMAEIGAPAAAVNAENEEELKKVEGAIEEEVESILGSGRSDESLNKSGQMTARQRLDILLDAGNLAVFYSKGRNNGEGDLFYTPVKYLRRPKDGPKGLVLPTQEKNLRVKVEPARLRELEACKVEK